MFLFQYLPFLQDPAISVRDIPDSEIHDGGAQHGLHPTVSKETLATREDLHMKGQASCFLSYFLKCGVIMKLGPLLLLIPTFDRNWILEIIFFTFWTITEIMKTGFGGKLLDQEGKCVY